MVKNEYNLAWKDAMNTGIEAIDAGHKKLFALIVELSKAIDTEQDKKTLEAIFVRIEKYVIYDFIREEELMRTCQYDELESHVQLHRAFTDAVPNLKEKLLTSTSKQVAGETYLFLFNWLVNHIVGEDMKFCQQAFDHGLIAPAKKQEKNGLLHRLSLTLARHLTFQWRVRLISLLPIMGMMALSLFILSENLQQYNELKTLQKSFHIIHAASQMNHSLQAERGLSATYIASKHELFSSKLAKQRSQTDSDAKELFIQVSHLSNNWSDKILLQYIQATHAHLSKLNDYRQSIDHNNMSVQKTLAFYTEFIDILRDVPDSMAHLNMPSSLSNTIIAFASMMHKKEAMGLQRAMGSRILAGQATSEDSLQAYLKINHEKHAAKGMFEHAATRQQKQDWQRIQQTAAQYNAAKRESSLIAFFNGVTPTLNSTQWFQASSIEINQTMLMGESLLNDLQENTQTLMDKLSTKFYMSSFILLLLMLLTIFFSRMLTGSITYLLKRMTHAMVSLSQGNRDIRLNEQFAHDAFDIMADAYETCRVNLLQSDLATTIYVRNKKNEWERKLSEKKIQSTIQNYALDSIITCDKNFIITDINPSTESAFGMQKKEALGKSLKDMLMDVENQTLNTRCTTHGVRADQTSFAVESSLSRMTLEGFDGLICFVRDISEQQEAEENYKLLIESSIALSGQAYFDEITQLLCRWLDADCAIIGELDSKGQVHARSMILDGEKVMDYSYGLVNTPCKEVASKGFCIHEQNIQNMFPQDQDLISMNAEGYIGSAIIDAQTKQVIGVLCIISRQPLKAPRYADETLAEIASKVSAEFVRIKADAKLKKLSQAIGQAGESILITDRQGTIEYVNHAFTKLTGYSSDEAIGNTPRMLKSGNQPQAFYENMWQTITSGKTWQNKVVERAKDGSFFPVILTIASITDENDKITHFVGTHTDISDLEDMEKQFRQAQKMEAIGTLVGGIAHDFNNMLAGITGNLYLAKRDTQDMPKVNKKLRNIEDLSFRAAAMIQQLLTFARKDRVSIQLLPFTPFIKETMKFLHPSIPENIQLEKTLCTDALPIRGDATQLHQVLMNLVNNACDAVEDVSDPNILVCLEAFQADEAWVQNNESFSIGSYAHLSVADNGYGICDAHLEHLFEPFFTNKEQGKGTGLGLSMVFGAVANHNGCITVESVEGKGSTFHIYIPLETTESMDVIAAKDTAIIPPSVHGELILLADDQDLVLEVAQEVLESMGYQILTATNGQLAVDLYKARADEIDLCIFDVVMPVLGGDKAAALIRDINPDVKIIFATGYDKTLLRGMENESVLSKPFDFNVMNGLIQALLHTKSS